ncbi:hypothetical protein AMAG_15900 [Allomyces macrogynus ATCC 38327]|uniref:G-protein coupled receptors family 1 profile domain-containing protein n=1 Tax=Allomyces macrogynus (strain ATCC 38327) TaxID=578462 RepID=A0A0L0T952_ALLM3|nr:hypothetical protein AMAG_15900 [Allomyces macrogynus ATCC 38327]|eukprot:KNE71246.1 hypothetical protein AMAG_15900 [Allomyces macrogynus ATCC 38327]
MSLFRDLPWPLPEWIARAGPTRVRSTSLDNHDRRSITGGGFVWSSSTFILALVLVLYASTTWNAVRLFWRRRSRFYAAMLVLIVVQLYDMTFTLFWLYTGATTVQMVLDYLACATFTILFSVLNLLRFRQIGEATWPRTTIFLGMCTALFAIYWVTHMIIGWYSIASTGCYGLPGGVTNDMFAIGYLSDAALNGALSTAFLVQLRAMSRGNVFRAGMQRYVTKAQFLLVFESVSLAAVLALQLIDPAVDPLWMTAYLAQGIRMAAYCTLLDLLTRIMARRRKASRITQSTSLSGPEAGGAGGSANACVLAAAQTRLASERAASGAATSRRAASGGKASGAPSTIETMPPSLQRSADMSGT